MCYLLTLYLSYITQKSALKHCTYFLYMTDLDYVILEIKFVVTWYLSNLWLYNSLLDLGRFITVSNFYTVDSTPRTGDHPETRPLPAHRTAQTE
jgi:hypothetical protein